MSPSTPAEGESTISVSNQQALFLQDRRQAKQEIDDVSRVSDLVKQMQTSFNHVTEHLLANLDKVIDAFAQERRSNFAEQITIGVKLKREATTAEEREMADMLVEYAKQSMQLDLQRQLRQLTPPATDTVDPAPRKRQRKSNDA